MTTIDSPQSHPDTIAVAPGTPTPISTRARLAAALATACGVALAGLLTAPAPAQAAPPCSQWSFTGHTVLVQSNGWRVDFNSTGPNAQGRVRAVDSPGDSPTGYGTINNGGLLSDSSIVLYVHWDAGSNQTYSGTVDDNGNATGITHNASYPTPDEVTWHSTTPLQCSTPAAPPALPPAPGPPQHPSPVGRVNVLFPTISSGPTTLAAGLSGTYVVTITNTFADAQPVRAGIVYAGKLEQTGQIVADSGLDCVVAHDAGINAAVNCTGLIPPGTSTITVQGRGSAPGPGTLVASLNGDVKQKDIAIT